MRLPLCTLRTKSDGVWSSPKNIAGGCPRLVSQSISFAWTPDQSAPQTWNKDEPTATGGYIWTKTAVARDSGKPSVIVMPTKMNSEPQEPVVKSVNGVEPDVTGNIPQSVFQFFGLHKYSKTVDTVIGSLFDKKISIPLNVGLVIINVTTDRSVYAQVRLVRTDTSGHPDHYAPTYGDAVLDTGMCSFCIDTDMTETQALELYFFSADVVAHGFYADVDFYTQREAVIT